MQESLALFTEVAGNPVFEKTPMFVFLNKKDLFEEMIATKVRLRLRLEVVVMVVMVLVVLVRVVVLGLVLVALMLVLVLVQYYQIIPGIFYL